MAVSTAGAAVVAAPGLISVTLLSSMGFAVGGIQAGEQKPMKHASFEPG